MPIQLNAPSSRNELLVASMQPKKIILAALSGKAARSGDAIPSRRIPRVTSNQAESANWCTQAWNIKEAFLGSFNFAASSVLFVLFT